ncbi:sensor domain-containing diguanylate cyclase [Bacillus shivajii]|uniref:sensor domain-containing diguanylate cyclase n=1 Tax=Bacillus shivajii TaxID=1983719 RepID=UPI001CFBC172|nr:sensor domain-containing diguanylate cyclase [Bacillus shivajii]UCZ52103.1 sensor domain-containing diguanylate cyclase [Bacillus shivajii]
MLKGKKKLIWAIWISVLLIYTFFFIQQTYTIFMNNSLAILSFLLLLLIAAFFPLRIHHTNIVPLHGISLAIFLQFGLVIEVMATQLALLTALLSLRLTRREIYRLPLNSLIFFAVSLTSGAVYYLLGGTTGNFSESSLNNGLIPVLAYAVTYFFLNNWLVFLARKYFAKVEGTKFFDQGLAWEAVSAILIIPVGLTLTILFNQIGYFAILLMGIPFISLSLILKLYNQSETTNRLLKRVSSYGYKTNENLSVQEIVDLFIETVSKVFPIDDAYLYEKHNDKIRAIQVYHSDQDSDIALKNGDVISQTVFQNGTSVHYKSQKEWEKVGQEKSFEKAQSIMSAPAIRNQKVEGVITLVSERKRAFDKSHLMLLEIMASYLAVAVQNARNYEKTKHESERCHLTKLYNFRYFENLLFEKYDATHSNEELAIILLDLDHFKQVNDTFGHQGGNDVLTQVADVLVKTVGDCGTVARYGGEEFVVLLEGVDLTFGEKMAEEIRRSIESHIFSVSDDLKSRDRKPVRITASIGVASRTEPGESAMAVLRNADRAMYTGAKQKGRNKVAQFG